MTVIFKDKKKLKVNKFFQKKILFYIIEQFQKYNSFLITFKGFYVNLFENDSIIHIPLSFQASFSMRILAYIRIFHYQFLVFSYIILIFLALQNIFSLYINSFQMFMKDLIFLKIKSK